MWQSPCCDSELLLLVDFVGWICEASDVYMQSLYEGSDG